MKPHWSPTTWLAVIAGLILLIVGIDIGRNALVAAPEIPPDVEPEASTSKDPDFKVGDKAPDFTLKDRAGVEHALSNEVKSDTSLNFICGCSACEDMQKWMSKLWKKMGPKAPPVISVSTAAKEAEASWFRRTQLKQTILYDDDRTKVGDKYKGTPCPRIFRVKPDLTVAWIGPSPIADMPLDYMKKQVAELYGFQDPHGTDTTKPKAPPYEDAPAPAPGADKAGIAQADPRKRDPSLPPYLAPSPYENK